MLEQLTSSYTSIMLAAMEHTVKQSQMLRERIDQVVERALKVWQASLPPDQNQLIEEALTSLQTQIQILTEKVDKLEEAAQVKMHNSTLVDK